MFAFLASTTNTTALNPNEVISHAVGGLVAIAVLFGSVFLVGLFFWVVVQRRRGRAAWRRLARSGIYEVDMMDGSEFERFLAVMFRRLGYGVQLVGGQGDFGADLIVNRDGTKVVVQAKCWSRTVGPGAVQEVLGARGYYRCQRALVVANQAFTPAAQSLARANDVELWGRTELIAKLTYLNDAASGTTANIRTTMAAAAPAKPPYAPAPPSVPVAPAPPAVPVAPAPMAGTFPVANRCAFCGTAVPAEVRDFCLSRAGRFQGQVYCRSHQRAFPRVAGPPR